MSLLSVAHLAKSYGGVAALSDASLRLEAGEALALMGENGAGKSTLIKILAGAEHADGGEIRIDGEAVSIRNPQEAHRRGLRFIHQELNVVPQLSVAENLFLGRPYPRRLGALVDWRRLNVEGRAALDALGVGHVAPEATMARLAVGDRMLVKIAAAFLEDAAAPARVFVMDEPTAALTGEESERLFRIIGELKRRGCGVIYVSHRIDETLRLCERIVVLRDGRSAAEFAAAEATKAGLIAAMTGRAVAETAPARGASPEGRVVLAVEGLGAGALADVSFEVRAGEILGIAGLSDAGQERLLKAMMGGAERGRVVVDGRPLRGGGTAEAWAAGLAYAPRERRSEGLLLSQDVTRNVALPHLKRLSRLGAFADARAERARATDMAQRVRLKAAGVGQRVWRLSGGNQQKTMFARSIAGGPRALLLDEPTRGVDVGAKFDIHALLRELAAGGAAIVVASSDHEELLALADRIAILRRGRLARIVPAEGLTPARLLALCYGEAAA